MALIELPEILRARLTLGAEVKAARDASTVVLTRDGTQGIEVFLMRRQSTMAFAPGMFVFPGGSVHDSDKDPSIAWVGPSAEQWASWLGCDAELGRGLVVAAIRELYEEASVLLAGTTDTIDISSARMQSARKVLDSDQLSMAAFLKENDFALRTDLLYPWARWITPEFEPKRFDTRFFVAAIPENQEVGELSIEADMGFWMRVDEVIAKFEEGSIAMLPPTEMTCRSLQGLTTQELRELSLKRNMDPIMPTLVEIDGTLYLDVDEIEP